MSRQLPPEVLALIERDARENWPEDEGMRRSQIDTEVAAYQSFVSLDFGAAAQVKATILAEADASCATWEEKLDYVTEEITAFQTLAALAPDDVPFDVVSERKREAAEARSGFADQLAFVNQAIERHREVELVRAEIGPVRDILERMEAIIGAACYNGYIENFRAWGVRDLPGRSYRYPVRFLKDGKDFRSRRVGELEPEVLITGHYQFGANKLHIYRALMQVVDVLKAEYGLRIPSKDDQA